jgi:GT2 family glycosyltransferase
VLALHQSRPPAEIIVVDASDGWAQTRERILADREVRSAAINIQYLEATDRSLCRQRNQGLRFATSDIVFLFDDDSLMFPDCAEQIMSVYEKDTDYLVAGVQSNLTNEIPAGTALNDTEKVVGLQDRGSHGQPRVQNDLLRRCANWAWWNVFLMHYTKTFIPYDGAYHGRPMPEQLVGEPVVPEVLLHGCRMTFRRPVIMAEQFEPLMLSYCPGEDVDASYRASRHGILVTATKAFLHHYQSGGGRIDRYTVSLLTTMNQAMCLRRHAKQLQRRTYDFWVLMLRKMCAELCKDALSRRWDLPQFKGLLHSVRVSYTILRLSPDELERLYPHLQQRVLRGLPPLHREKIDQGVSKEWL